MLHATRNVARKYGAKLVTGALVAAPLLARADTTSTFDPTTYVAVIVATIAGLLAIGGAVFGLNVAIKSTKWARKAL